MPEVTAEQIVAVAMDKWPDVGVVKLDYTWTKTQGASWGILVGPSTSHRFAASADTLADLLAKLQATNKQE